MIELFSLTYLIFLFRIIHVKNIIPIYYLFCFLTYLVYLSVPIFPLSQALTNPITNPTPATRTQIKKLPTLSYSLNFNNLFSSSRILSLLKNPSSSLEYLSNSLCLSMNDCFLFMIYFIFYSQVKYSQFKRQSRFQGFFRKRT